MNTAQCNFNVTVNPSSSVKITIQPNDKKVVVGQNTEFSVKATAEGATLTYQWQVKTPGSSAFVNLRDSQHYSGTNTDTLRIIDTPASFKGNLYRVAITVNDICVSTLANIIAVATPQQTTVFSDPARLTVVALPPVPPIPPVPRNIPTTVINTTQNIDWTIVKNTKSVMLDFSDPKHE